MKRQREFIDYIKDIQDMIDKINHFTENMDLLLKCHYAT
ncbi:hypothetical protein Dtox_0481 [Desulfofarcimen acetoxidans DSM 771]|jgi:uncharacterized protein with HEPN domain|uniref:Uncharacterized protein n=1 Tax=Desulfofarcimen acetoxidans (strain ATCC 49208 / DSM 771 / KCTC 5769 / VKM B-1644 / 5575) TaxID=485916 RepID=C8W556_DESAS|nr:hypothetical protein Dtox_0481 [Desulfofarcimen acetoxidans DSM 771]